MAKGNGGTRSARAAVATPPRTFEEQVDSALVGLRKDFFGKMEDWYDNWLSRWQESFDEWKRKDIAIWGEGNNRGSISAPEYDRREREAYGERARRGIHTDTSRSLQHDFSDLVYGAFYTEGLKRPNFYALRRGEVSQGDMEKAVKATAQRIAEKKFADVRAKMLKTTVEKGIDLKRAQVKNASGDGFLISDGRVTLHARYVLAWGEVNAPHFRFIITDRKS